MEREGDQEREKQPPKRVIFEYPDGTVRYLEGGQAERWLTEINKHILTGDPYENDEIISMLNSRKWQMATSLRDILPTTRTAFDEALEERIDVFRNILPENPGLENYLKMIRSGAKVMTYSSPESLVLGWLDEQIQIAKMSKKDS